MKRKDTKPLNPSTCKSDYNIPFVETDHEPRADVTPDEVAKLPDNDLLTGLKKQYRRTRLEMEVYLIYFDEAVRRFAVKQPRSDGYQPLVKAFEAIVGGRVQLRVEMGESALSE